MAVIRGEYEIGREWPGPRDAGFSDNAAVPLVEELGAESGTVTDIFLPDWLSRRIPMYSGGLLVVGMILNMRALRRA